MSYETLSLDSNGLEIGSGRQAPANQRLARLSAFARPQALHAWSLHRGLDHRLVRLFVQPVADSWRDLRLRAPNRVAN